jgi:hypothetical protein
VSNDGHGELPRRQIEEGLAGGALVHCGFDNDAGGTKLWAQVKEAYPRAEAIERERPPAGAKDWNDALRAAPGRAAGAEGHSQGQEDDRVPSRGRGHGGRDEHSRS